jgi:hypothetical protein
MLCTTNDSPGREHFLPGLTIWARAKLALLEQNQASCPQFWQVLNHAEAFSVEICGSAFLMAW